MGQGGGPGAGGAGGEAREELGGHQPGDEETRQQEVHVMVLSELIIPS